MIIKTLNQSKSKIEMENWLKTKALQDLDTIEYKKIRDELTFLYDKISKKLKYQNSSRFLYHKDVFFGVLLYDYFNKYEWFNLRVAANIDFWRYISIIVCPNIVFDRWGDKEERYWKRSNRVWFSQIWWYIHLSYQKDTATTLKLLVNPRFTTDTILNLVDRTGSKGFNVNLYREIMYRLSLVPQNKYDLVKSAFSNANESVFRVIMKLNNAKVLNVDPELFNDGVKGYVKSLFVDIGLESEETIWI